MASSHLLVKRVFVASFSNVVENDDVARVADAVAAAHAKLHRPLLYIAFTSETTTPPDSSLRMSLHAYGRQIFALAEYAAIVIPGDCAEKRYQRAAALCAYVDQRLRCRVNVHSSLQTVGVELAPAVREECVFAITIARARGLLPAGQAQRSFFAGALRLGA
jgi:hypothetical protein